MLRLERESEIDRGRLCDGPLFRLNFSFSLRSWLTVVAQLEGQVLFAKLYNNTAPLEALWQNCLALLGARLPETGPVTV